MKTIIKNGTIVNEGKRFTADILISNGRIEKIAPQISVTEKVQEVDASGLLVLPGCIDDQVHFREPGLTHKGNIYTESRAAVVLDGSEVVIIARSRCWRHHQLHGNAQYRSKRTHPRLTRRQIPNSCPKCTGQLLLFHGCLQ